MNNYTLLCLLIVCVIVLFGQLGTCANVELKHHVREGNIELNISVNVNGQPIKQKEHVTPHALHAQANVNVGRNQSKQVKTLVDQVSKTISSDEEKKISEQLLINGNKLSQIANMITGNSQEETKLKSKFLALAGELSKESKKPSALILESSYVIAQHRLDNQFKQSKLSKSTESSGASAFTHNEPLLQASLSPRKPQQGANTLITPIIVGGVVAASVVTDIIDGVGTYSETLESVSKWTKDTAANKLDSMGMNTLANVARKTGQSMNDLSIKVAPYEKQLAEKLKPMVTDSTYRTGKFAVDTVATVSSIAGAAKSLVKNSVKLTDNFQKLQSSLSDLSKTVENPKQLVEGITGAALSGFNRLTGKTGVISNTVLGKAITRNVNLIGTTGMRVNNVVGAVNEIKEGIEKLGGKKKSLGEKLKEKLSIGNLAKTALKSKLGKAAIKGIKGIAKGKAKAKSTKNQKANKTSASKKGKASAGRGKASGKSSKSGKNSGRGKSGTSKGGNKGKGGSKGAGRGSSRGGAGKSGSRGGSAKGGARGGGSRGSSRGGGSRGGGGSKGGRGGGGRGGGKGGRK